MSIGTKIYTDSQLSLYTDTVPDLEDTTEAVQLTMYKFPLTSLNIWLFLTPTSLYPLPCSTAQSCPSNWDLTFSLLVLLFYLLPLLFFKNFF